MVTNLHFDSILSHRSQLAFVGLVLAHAIYEILDKTTVLVKFLVGEEYDADLKMFSLEGSKRTD
jgi:hypothetical protein